MVCHSNWSFCLSQSFSFSLLSFLHNFLQEKLQPFATQLRHITPIDLSGGSNSSDSSLLVKLPFIGFYDASPALLPLWPWAPSLAVNSLQVVVWIWVKSTKDFFAHILQNFCEFIILNQNLLPTSGGERCSVWFHPTNWLWRMCRCNFQEV